MYSLNKVMLIGNLTRDPEARSTPDGTQISNFSVATNFSWTDQSGQKQDRAEFHNIVAWRKLAEICNQYLRKGSKVYVEGRLQTRRWDDATGQKKYRTEVVLDSMIMLDSKGAGAAGTIQRGTSDQQETQRSAFSEPTINLDETPGVVQNTGVSQNPSADDIPFWQLQIYEYTFWDYRKWLPMPFNNIRRYLPALPPASPERDESRQVVIQFDL